MGFCTAPAPQRSIYFNHNIAALCSCDTFCIGFFLHFSLYFSLAFNKNVFVEAAPRFLSYMPGIRCCKLDRTKFWKVLCLGNKEGEK